MNKFLLFVMCLSVGEIYTDNELLFSHRLLELHQENEDLRDENEDLRYENEDLRYENENLRVRCHQLSEQLTGCQQELESEKDMLQELQHEIDALSRDNQGFLASIDKLHDENEILEERIQFCRVQLRHLSGESLELFDVDNNDEEIV